MSKKNPTSTVLQLEITPTPGYPLLMFEYLPPRPRPPRHRPSHRGLPPPPTPPLRSDDKLRATTGEGGDDTTNREEDQRRRRRRRRQNGDNGTIAVPLRARPRTALLG